MDSLNLVLHLELLSIYPLGKSDFCIKAIACSGSNLYRYRRYELASRFAVYYTAVAVAGAISGLLAGLITEYLDGVRGIAGWRWLFVSRPRGDCALCSNPS